MSRTPVILGGAIGAVALLPLVLALAVLGPVAAVVAASLTAVLAGWVVGTDGLQTRVACERCGNANEDERVICADCGHPL